MTLTIPANDHGQLRIFSLDFPPPDALRDKTIEGLAGAFGATLNPDFVDVIDLAALDDMSLIAYLKAGYDLTPDAVDHAALSGLSGWVVLVMSTAFGEDAITLNLTSGLTHITTLGDAASLTALDPLTSDAAKGVATPPTPKPAKSDARIGGMVATVALLMMFALVGIMIWIGG